MKYDTKLDSFVSDRIQEIFPQIVIIVIELQFIAYMQ